MRHARPGSGGGTGSWGATDDAVNKAKALATKSSSYAGLVLLLIACTLAFMPDIPHTVKDFLMVAFACVALLPGHKVS